MEDEVDRLVTSWARERPDLDLSAMQVLSRVSRLARRLDAARKDSFTSHQIVAWEFDVLAALRRAGRPYTLSPGALIRETLVTSGTMTNRVDRLVSRGMVTRNADPSDRRGVLVTLTPTGRDTVDGALTSLLTAERRLLAGLDHAEQTRLADLLRSLGLTIDSELVA